MSKVFNIVVNKGGSSEMEYLDVSNLEKSIQIKILNLSYTFKGKVDASEASIDLIYISALGIISAISSPDSVSISEILFNPDIIIFDSTQNKLVGVKEVLIQEIGEEAYNAIPRITKEQYYDITLPTE